jgi:hypothetical protein
MSKKLLTRNELWANYRNDINHNIILEKALINSSEKLHILFERLKQFYPSFSFTNFDINKGINLEDISNVTKLDIPGFAEIIEEINEFENYHDSSLEYISDINFSSNGLDDVIKNIQKGKINDTEYINTTNTETQIIKSKKIFLAKRGTDE